MCLIRFLKRRVMEIQIGRKCFVPTLFAVVWNLIPCSQGTSYHLRVDNIILRANLRLTRALGKHLVHFVLCMEYTVHTVPAETLDSDDASGLKKLYLSIKSSRAIDGVNSEQKSNVSENYCYGDGIIPWWWTQNGSETLGFCSELTRLIAREYFITFNRCENLKC
jgi:hypothetical protein